MTAQAYSYLFAAAALVACGKQAETTSDAAPEVDAPLADSSTPIATFTYKPGWSGVTTVEIVGALQGASGPWTQLASLTAGSDGTFTGQATQLAAGTYDYLIHTVGDADAGAKADTLDHYAIDPGNATFEACPPDSPSAGGDAPNPCSLLSVPQGTPATLFHVTGRVMVDDAVGTSFLVLIERQEDDSHHFFANRTTTGNDGTYDFAVAPGRYRIQVQHPQYEAKMDAQLDPTKLNLYRRNLASSFDVAADVAVSDSQMAFHDYAKFAPVTDKAVLPTTFTYAKIKARLEVYGPKDEIGDPWFNGPTDATGTAQFNGRFNTNKAKEETVTAGSQYLWGIEAPQPADGNGIVWTSQSLVFPITWSE